MLIPDKLNGVYHGDARELCVDIPDNSVDLIFTDPPYLKEYVPLYGWLAEEASRILTPDGFLLCYVGGYWKAKIMRMMGEFLEYYWDFIELDSGNSPVVWQRKVITKCKSILAWRKQGSKAKARTNVLGVWTGGGDDKRYHIWGQDESTARYYIDCFSEFDDIVLDPFCGGGTTPAICELLGRRYLAFDIEEECVKASEEHVRDISQRGEFRLWENGRLF